MTTPESRAERATTEEPSAAEPGPEAPGAAPAVDYAHQCEAVDLSVLLEAASERLQKNQDSAAATLLSCAPHIRADTVAEPPPALRLVRAHAVTVCNQINSGEPAEKERSLMIEGAEASIALLEELLR